MDTRLTQPSICRNLDTIFPSFGIEIGVISPFQASSSNIPAQTNPPGIPSAWAQTLVLIHWSVSLAG